MKLRKRLQEVVALTRFNHVIARRPGRSLAEGITSAPELGRPIYERALEEHRDYVHALERCGVDITILPALEAYPDSCFVEDPAVITRCGAIITNPGAASRNGEKDEIEPVIRRFFSDDQIARIEAPGTLEGGDCPRCRNKGLIYGLAENGDEYAEECTCMEARRAKQEIKDSEYSALLRKCTFTRYTIRHEWQRAALLRCKDWLRQRRFPMLYLGGRTGAGKTHLAVAAFAERVRMGLHGTFVNWRTVSEWLKYNKKDAEYEKRLNGLKRTPLLLMDDFLWQPKGAAPTAEDFRLAKEIVDARLYNGRATILTGNYTVRELYALSEELGGRIVEGTGGEERFALRFGAETVNIRLEEIAADGTCPF